MDIFDANETMLADRLINAFNDFVKSSMNNNY